MKKGIFFSIMLMSVLMAADVWAAKLSRMETTILREKKQHDFAPVTGMWRTDATFLQAKADALVNRSVSLVVDNAMKSRLMEEQPAFITLTVPNPSGGYYEVELMKYSILAEGFKVATNAHGIATDFTYTPGVFYRGVVKDVPGSLASISFFSNEVYGVFSIPSLGNVMLVPNTLIQPVTGSNYIVYNDMDLKETPKSAGCGTDATMLPQPGGALGKTVLSSCKEIQEFIKADFDTYMDFGGNANAVTNIANYMTAVFNMVSTIYRNEDVYTSIKRIEVNTTVDVYYNVAPKESKNYLNEMNADITNMYGADLALVVSTIDEGMGGIAWLNAVCAAPGGSGHGPYAFCNINHDWFGTTLPTYNWDIKVLTHEMGHNMGSKHTHDCVWNGNNTAIDGCGPSEGYPSAYGSCTVMPFPVSGGTIMSYCHLVGGVGVNFANGFGSGPAQAIKDFIEQSSCAAKLAASPLNEADKTIAANCECTSEDVTYYWNDQNTANRSDDKLILAIAKNSNDIGSIEDVDFNIYASTTTDYGNGTGKGAIMPAGTKGVSNVVLGARYWKMETSKQPSSPVEVRFPITKKDIADIDGGMTANIKLNDLGMYSLTGNFNPSPVNVSSLSSLNLKTYTYDANSASAAKWATSSSTADTTIVAIVTKELYGGGMYGVVSFPLGVNNISNTDQISFYPNPATREWAAILPANVANVTLTLYSTDGRVVVTQELKAGEANYINAEKLSAGIYLYRATGSVNYTGILNKQ